MSFFPKQLQLMGFLILAQKQTLLQHDFQVCLPLSPFASLLLDPVSSWFPGFFCPCLPSTGSCFVMISLFVSLCLPSTGSCFVMISSLLSSLSPFYWILSHHEFEASLCFCPFVSLLLDPAHHDCEASPRWLPSYRIKFHNDFEAISLCLPFSPPTGSSSVTISRPVFLCLPYWI